MHITCTFVCLKITVAEFDFVNKSAASVPDVTGLDPIFVTPAMLLDGLDGRSGVVATRASLGQQVAVLVR